MNSAQGTIHVHWEVRDAAIVLKPFFSLADSAPPFNRLKRLLADLGGIGSFTAQVTPDGAILLYSGGALEGSDLELAAPPITVQLQRCPDCGADLVPRGPATGCMNCGFTTGTT